MHAAKSLLTFLAALVVAAPAGAYCRATTCDPMLESCAEDSEGCVGAGLPVFWESSCITVSVQADGAPRAGIDYEAVRQSVERAFDAWTNVSCPGGGKPSISVIVEGPVSCDESEYNPKQGNANIVMFRDRAWPYDGTSQDTLGFTNVRFNRDDGALYDVDIEINAVSEPLSSGTPGPSEIDLDSVIMHEAGHLLGLNHSLEAGATMEAGYAPGSTAPRTPSADDIAAICAIYPPGRKAASDDCEPRHGFSELCAAEQVAEPEPEPLDEAPAESQGCSVSAAHGTHDAGLAFALALGGACSWLERWQRTRRLARPALARAPLAP